MLHQHHLGALSMLLRLFGAVTLAVGVDKVDHSLACLCREQLEHIANTLVFMLSGVIIAGRIYISSTQGLGYIKGQEYGYAALLWVYLTVSLLGSCHRTFARRLSPPLMALGFIAFLFLWGFLLFLWGFLNLYRPA